MSDEMAMLHGCEAATLRSLGLGTLLQALWAPQGYGAGPPGTRVLRGGDAPGGKVWGIWRSSSWWSCIQGPPSPS